ncbi:MAG TPA: L-seryl-tRNA(Sec) selenium transferase [Candidatus Eremiobacteraceae bacterium]|nr:L-seryl-tRNA(Sec) selenium transferase [Candidatus Eremiobacteraceae bacterium]
MDNSLRRAIPAVHRFTADPDVSAFNGVLGRGAVRTAVQQVLDDARARAQTTTSPPDDATLKRRMLGLLAASESAGLLRLINGTGVILHTNFGRAPLAGAALDAIGALGAGYTNLEYDLTSAKRGSRYARVAAQLRELTGAESSLLVNNCAAAVVLVLDTFANGRDVVVSRGQLVEIGGGFRLPDVLRKSGANLIEVGTTNRTYASDYRDAWSPGTAMFMRTHPSNFRVDGFTADVSAQALAALAKELDVLSFEDLGSGALIDFAQFGLPSEPTVAQEIAAGLDLVAVSGDKLLGGPQCGIICGRADLIDRMRANPMLRALRTDKIAIAALSATLALYLEPDRLRELPLVSMLALSCDELFSRAAALCAKLTGGSARFRPVLTSAATGGGTMPAADIPSAGIAVTPSNDSPHEFAARMCARRPPVIGRVQDDDFIVDLRTVRKDEDAELCAAFIACT